MVLDRNLVIVVCTANVCRSPMGEALLRHALGGAGDPLSRLEVISAGVAAYPGDPVTENSVAALKKVGIDISGHRSRPMNPELADRALAVYAMTESHLAILLERFPELDGRAFLFRQFIEGPEDSVDRTIPDPFGMDFSTYELTRDAMVEAIPSLKKHLLERIAEAPDN